MLRNEHNEQWNAHRRGDEEVLCSTFGYGEISQYDSRCSSCWLHHSHTWDHHDARIKDHMRAVK